MKDSINDHCGMFNDHNFTYDLEDGFFLNVKVTSEGVIFDYYRDNELYATEGMTADEWVYWMLARRSAVCEHCGVAISNKFGFGCCDDCSERLAKEFDNAENP